MSPMWISLELSMIEMVKRTVTIRRVKLQSNCHHQQTNTQLFTGWMNFPSHNQERQSTEGNIQCTLLAKIYYTLAINRLHTVITH